MPSSLQFLHLLSDAHSLLYLCLPFSRSSSKASTAPPWPTITYSLSWAPAVRYHPHKKRIKKKFFMLIPFTYSYRIIVYEKIMSFPETDKPKQDILTRFPKSFSCHFYALYSKNLLTTPLILFLFLNFFVKNMLYSIFSMIWYYLCIGKREKKFLGIN